MKHKFKLVSVQIIEFNFFILRNHKNSHYRSLHSFYFKYPIYLFLSFDKSNIVFFLTLTLVDEIAIGGKITIRRYYRYENVSN